MVQEAMDMVDISMMEDGKMWQKKLLKNINSIKIQKILDLGCGKGHLVYELFNILKSDNIFGIDISNYAIKKFSNRD